MTQAQISARFGGQTPVAVVQAVRGKVMIKPLPTSARSYIAKEGFPLFVGSVITTDTNGRIKILFVEGLSADPAQRNTSVLGGDTVFTLERASPTTMGRGTTLYLEKGSVQSDVKPTYSGVPPDTFEVRTPNSVAGVRGTLFTVVYTPPSGSQPAQTQVQVQNHQVYLRRLRQTAPGTFTPDPMHEVVIGQGQTSTVTGGPGAGGSYTDPNFPTDMQAFYTFPQDNPLPNIVRDLNTTFNLGDRPRNGINPINTDNGVNDGGNPGSNPPPGPNSNNMGGGNTTPPAPPPPTTPTPTPTPSPSPADSGDDDDCSGSVISTIICHVRGIFKNL